MTPTYEHYWERFEVPGQDGPQRLGYRSRIKRTDVEHFDYWTSVGIRARNRQAPPPADGPERFYRQERFGP